MALTPKEMNDQVTALVTSTVGDTEHGVTPARMKILLTELRAFTEKVNAAEMNAYVAGDIETPAHEILRADIQRWYNLMDYYDAQVAAASSQDASAIAETVTSPLLFGVCYGEPSCSAAAAASWAPGGFPMMPSIHIPFIILNGTGVAEETAYQNTFLTAVKDVLAEHAKAAKDAVKKGLKSALEAVPSFPIPVWAIALIGVFGFGVALALVRR